MAKNKAIEKYKEEHLEEDFDLFDNMELPEDEVVADMMHGLMEASKHQTLIAVELTKLIVEKNSNETMNEENILSIFKRSLNVVTESFPMKAIVEKL